MLAQSKQNKTGSHFVAVTVHGGFTSGARKNVLGRQLLRWCSDLSCITFGICLLASCRTATTIALPSEDFKHSSAVEIALLAEQGTDTYQVKTGENYLTPTPDPGNSLPTYPQNMLGKNIPAVTVIIKLVINKEGHPERWEISDGNDVDEEFREAVGNAVMHWRFSPLQRIRAGLAEPLPFSLRYRFVFRQQDGRPSVEQNSPS